jgi:hypothetical protein
MRLNFIRNSVPVILIVERCRMIASMLGKNRNVLGGSV